METRRVKHRPDQNNQVFGDLVQNETILNVWVRFKACSQHLNPSSVIRMYCQKG